MIIVIALLAVVGGLSPSGWAMGSGGGSDAPVSTGGAISGENLVYTSDFTITESLSNIPDIGQVLTYAIQNNSSSSYIWGFGVGLSSGNNSWLGLSLTTTPNPNWNNFYWKERQGWISSVVPSSELYSTVVKWYSAAGLEVPAGLFEELTTLYDGYDYVYLTSFDVFGEGSELGGPIGPGEYDDGFRIVFRDNELTLASPAVYVTTQTNQPPSQNNTPALSYNDTTHAPNGPSNNPVVPEPLTSILFGVGLVGVLLGRKQLN